MKELQNFPAFLKERLKERFPTWLETIVRCEKPKKGFTCAAGEKKLHASFFLLRLVLLVPSLQPWHTGFRRLDT